MPNVGIQGGLFETNFHVLRGDPCDPGPIYTKNPSDMGIVDPAFRTPK